MDPLPIGKQLSQELPLNAAAVEHDIHYNIVQCMEKVTHLQKNSLGSQTFNAELIWDLHKIKEKLEAHTNISNVGQSSSLES